MFKSTRKRQSNKIKFEEQLNQQLHQLKEETPQKLSHAQKNLEMATIIDEVVNELKTPNEGTPKKVAYRQHNNNPHEIHEIDALQLNENSSISLNSKVLDD